MLIPALAANLSEDIFVLSQIHSQLHVFYISQHQQTRGYEAFSINLFSGSALKCCSYEPSELFLLTSRQTHTSKHETQSNIFTVCGERAEK